MREDSFEDFFADEYPRLVRALYLVTGSQMEAEELAEEALARAYERWDRVRSMVSPGGYAYRTALNLHRKSLRRIAVAARRLLRAPPEPDAMQLVEIRSELRQALHALPPDQREALVLVVWLGMSSQEAAEILGVKASSVRSRVHRALARMQELLGGSHG